MGLDQKYAPVKFYEKSLAPRELMEKLNTLGELESFDDSKEKAFLRESVKAFELHQIFKELEGKRSEYLNPKKYNNALIFGGAILTAAAAIGAGYFLLKESNVKIPDSFTSKKKNTIPFNDATKNENESGELKDDKQNTCCSFCFSIYNLLPDQVKNTLARITILTRAGIAAVVWGNIARTLCRYYLPVEIIGKIIELERSYKFLKGL